MEINGIKIKDMKDVQDVLSSNLSYIYLNMYGVKIESEEIPDFNLSYTFKLYQKLLLLSSQNSKKQGL